MFIVYSGIGKQYASAAVSKRDGNETSMEYIYLGKVIDREAGIYQSRERGIFTFDVETATFGEVPEDFAFPQKQAPAKRKHISVDFGDCFFLNQFLWQSGMMEVVDQIGYGNPDTLHAMLLFYTLSGLANVDAIHWYEGNIVQLLYPRANMTSQRISDFLAAIGTPEKQMAFQTAYIDYVMGHYSPDRNILIDSSGLPNGIHMPATRINVHNGKVSNEVRLIFVVQRSTGLPLYYRAVPGNIVDVSTLERIFLHLDSMGIDVDSCIMDAGYNSSDNMDLFYDENHTCKIDFITRLKSGDKGFRTMVSEEFASLEQKENFVKYEDRYLFIKKRRVMVGSDKTNPAWMYLGLDCARLSDEQHKLLKRAARDNLTKDEVFDAMQGEGLFGVISGKEYSCEEILPAYYQRQAAEQIFDFAKNYTKLLPLRTNNSETFQGHLLLSYIASCAVKMIQLRLKVADLFLGSRLECMRNQKCTIYQNRIVTDDAQKEVNDTYAAFGMKCPSAIPIVDGALEYVPPVSDTLPPEKKKRKRKKRGENKASPDSSDARKPAAHCKPGRPKGSKNKKTLEREALEKELPAQSKRSRGRPKGSKNKKTIERELLEQSTEKKRRGRPKGSRNHKHLNE